MTVEVTGEPRARGRGHGEHLREEIKEFYDEYMASCAAGSYIRGPRVRAGSSETDLIETTGAFLPVCRTYAPELIEEIEGIAEGCGLSFEKIFALNCFDEIDCHGPDLLASDYRGCTAFAVTGAATVDGHALIGQTSDAPAHYPFFFLRSTSNTEPETLIMTCPGVLGVSGCNDRGLCQVWNTLKAADHRLGVPATFVVRKALQARGLAEMISNVLRSPRANGLNFVVGDGLQAVNLELSATRFHMVYCHDILTHANHYEAAEFVDLDREVRPGLADSFLRSGRMRELLESRAGRIDPESLQETMRDHCTGSGAICRHLDSGTKLAETKAAVVYAPAEGRLWAAIGNPCQVKFVEYGL